MTRRQTRIFTSSFFVFLPPIDLPLATQRQKYEACSFGTSLKLPMRPAAAAAVWIPVRFGRHHKFLSLAVGKSDAWSRIFRHSAPRRRSDAI